jgi:hypothetical protein
MPKRAPMTARKRPDAYTLRLDPKLRFAAELAASIQRRSLASLIEWAIDQATRQTIVTNSDGVETNALRVADEVWDEDELTCILLLADRYPLLLSTEQRRLRKLIQNIPPEKVPRRKSLSNELEVLDAKTREKVLEDWGSRKKSALERDDREVGDLKRRLKKPTRDSSSSQNPRNASSRGRKRKASLTSS